MDTPFDPAQYKDGYQKIIDLMDALKASIEKQSVSEAIRYPLERGQIRRKTHDY